MLVIAAIHGFRFGSYLNGNWYTLYYSYASDFMLPFGVYFLLALNEPQLRFLKKWFVKVLIVFLIMTLSEIMQFFGIHLFGVTFDWFDIAFYGFGALAAAFVDIQLFKCFLPFWKYDV